MRHFISELNEHHEGLVTLSGFLQEKRQTKHALFLELWESTGQCQLVLAGEMMEQASQIPRQSALTITGRVVPRKNPHPNLAHYPTGLWEVQVTEMNFVNPCERTPLLARENSSEEQLLAERFTSLRFKETQEALRKRHEVIRAMRHVLENERFVEIETPVLVRNTPGGAHPFLVPHAERHYALAQSPQLWKQMLVCGGFERYYQLAHCFRNEGARAERQPEFSQFEIEMAFVSREEVICYMEKCFRAAWGVFEEPKAIPRLTYFEAMQEFGTEKPNFNAAERLLGPLATPKTRFEEAEVCLEIKRSLAERFFAKTTPEKHVEVFFEKNQVIAKGPLESAQKTLGKILSLWAREGEQKILPSIVTEMPMFERGEFGEWVAAHHPFTRPLLAEQFLAGQHEEVMSNSFDLIVNGYEIGGGSMRIHEEHLQRQMFSKLKMSERETEEHFGFLLRALLTGAPPHGGWAFGVERLLMVLLGRERITEVMAFPKTVSGQCPLTGALS